jgi:predicted transposase YdaD
MVMTLVSAYDRMSVENQQKGKEEARKEIALRMASQGFQPEAIAAAVGLPLDQVQTLLAAQPQSKD